MTQGRPISRPVSKSHHNNPATLFSGLFATLSLHTVIFSISCPTAHLDATAGAPQCTREPTASCSIPARKAAECSSHTLPHTIHGLFLHFSTVCTTSHAFTTGNHLLCL
ncbi:hypothetical protein DL98DRAFT_84782 [Cadophora sp. DSE1049]|nr:hypothetical protein DL98DRAFT_84782 [Cadophora sp. DSE1049]